jgi:hypothetical protein
MEPATVVTVSPLTVRLDSSATAVPALCLGSYVPIAADRVSVDRQGSQVIVLGTTAAVAKVPFAQAAGSAFFSGTAVGNLSSWFWDTAVTVTFPTSRFTLAPLVTVTANLTGGGNAVIAIVAAAATTTSMTVYGMCLGATPLNTMGFSWRAVQMTSSSAAG